LYISKYYSKKELLNILSKIVSHNETKNKILKRLIELEILEKMEDNEIYKMKK
jgi:hypothetical protein